MPRLQQQNEQLRNKLFGRSSERSGKDKPPGNGSGKRGNPNGGAPERTRLPSEQFPNARIHEVTLEDQAAPTCAECQQSMTDSGLRESAERMEYQLAEVYILRTHRVRYQCKCCQSAPQTSALPERLAPGSSLGDSLILQSCISKFYDLIPTTRFAKILARGKAALAHRLLLKAQAVAAFMLMAVYRAIKEEILASGVIHADETIHRQLEENGGKWRWYLWGFSNQISIYFEIHDTRAGDVSIEFLMESLVLFLVSDAYSGYSRPLSRDPMNNVNSEASRSCNPVSAMITEGGTSFMLRKHRWRKKRSILYDAIYKIEEQVQDLLKIPRYQEPENSAQALCLRQTADPLF